MHATNFEGNKFNVRMCMQKKKKKQKKTIPLKVLIRLDFLEHTNAPDGAFFLLNKI